MSIANALKDIITGTITRVGAAAVVSAFLTIPVLLLLGTEPMETWAVMTVAFTLFMGEYN